MHQRCVTRRHRDEQPRRLETPPSRRHGTELFLFRADNFGVPALRGAEDFVAGFEFVAGRGGGGDGGDGAGEFGAGGPGQGWLVLVFAPDLQQVEEVCRRAVDADGVLGGLGGGFGEVCHAEVLRSLGEGVSGGFWVRWAGEGSLRRRIL